MPDKDIKAMMGTEDTPGGKASPDPQDSRPSVFHSIKVPLGSGRGKAIRVQQSRICHLLAV